MLEDVPAIDPNELLFQGIVIRLTFRRYPHSDYRGVGAVFVSEVDGTIS
jgi:hypothetical protein